MPGDITKLLYIFTVTAPPHVLEYMQNELNRSTVDGLFFRAKRKGKEKFLIDDREYEIHYDSQFHYKIIKIIE
ncbi:MAG: hypothetical protein V1838_02880 [Patescibacteria group bacterium]